MTLVLVEKVKNLFARDNFHVQDASCSNDLWISRSGVTKYLNLRHLRRKILQTFKPLMIVDRRFGGTFLAKFQLNFLLGLPH